jgi:hypothetical protein
VVRHAGHYFKQPTRHDHPAIGVADVLVWLEQGAAVPAEPVEEDTEGAGTLSVREEQVGIDPIRVRQQMPDADLLRRPRAGQLKLRQIPDDALSKTDDAALHLLQNERRGQDLRNGSKKETGVLTHRRTRDDVRYPMSRDDLNTVVVDPSNISRDLARLAIGRNLIANLRSDSLKPPVAPRR